MAQKGGFFEMQRREDVKDRWRDICQQIAQALSPPASSPPPPPPPSAAVHCWLDVVLPGLSERDIPAAIGLVLPPLAGLVARTASQLLTDLSQPNAKGATEPFLQSFSLLEVCVKAVLSTAERLSGYLHCFLFATLTALLATLQLCKEVETQCGWAFEPFSRQLSGLFKQAFLLLKMAAENLDKVKVQQCEVTALTEDIAQLLEVARFTATFDPSLIVLAWKALGKIICRVKGRLHDNWSIRPIITELCVTMETKASECIQYAPTLTNEKAHPQPLYGKLLKLCRLLTTLLVKLVQEFEDSSHEYADVLLHLLLNVHTTIPPYSPPDPPPPPDQPQAPPLGSNYSSLAATLLPQAIEDMDTHILLVREPLMAALLDCQVFIKLLLTPPPTGDGSRDVGVVKGRGYAWAVCLCSLLKFFHKLPDGLQDYCMDSATSREALSGHCRLVDAVFTSLAMCYVELQVPVRVAGIMCNGRPQCKVTLFEHVCTHLSAVAAHMPARHFPALEWSLLRWLLSGDVHCSLLASDVWSHLASVCCDEVRFSHVLLLAKILEALPESHTPSYVSMVTLLNRILARLSAKHQEQFVSAHPPGPPHAKLWSLVRPQALTQCQVWPLLADECVRVLSAEVQSGRPNGAAMYRGLRTLTSIYSTPAAAAAATARLDPAHSSTLLHTAWGIATSTSLPDSLAQLSVPVRCEALLLLATMLHRLPAQELLRVLGWLCEQVTTSSFSSRPPPPPPPPPLELPIALAVCSILTHCGPLSLPPPLERDYQRGVSRLFLTLLSPQSGRGRWLLQHSALEAFKAFAELTPYPAMVESCIPDGQRDAVVSFLNQTVEPAPCHHGSSDGGSACCSLVAVLGWRGEWRRRGEGGAGGGKAKAAPVTSNHNHSQELDDSLAQMLSLWTQVANSNSLHPSATQLAQLQGMCDAIQQFISSHSPHPPLPMIYKPMNKE